MQKVKLEDNTCDEVEVDSETLASIDLGIQSANSGMTVSMDKAREEFAQWIMKLESQQQHLKNLER